MFLRLLPTTIGFTPYDVLHFIASEFLDSDHRAVLEFRQIRPSCCGLSKRMEWNSLINYVWQWMIADYMEVKTGTATSVSFSFNCFLFGHGSDGARASYRFVLNI